LTPDTWAPLIYALLLLIIGFGLILLEIFVIPGINIFGIVGFVTMCAGVWYAYAKLGTGYAAVVAVLGLGGTFVLVRLLIRVRAWHRIVLDAETGQEQGYDSSAPGLADLNGLSGEALTPLRPAGRAKFGERVIDVVTEGDFVSTGEPIEVVEIGGNRVVVQKLTDKGEAG
jgi:membrane-bound serine protease (ClpP class)